MWSPGLVIFFYLFMKRIGNSSLPLWLLLKLMSLRRDEKGHGHLLGHTLGKEGDQGNTSGLIFPSADN